MVDFIAPGIYTKEFQEDSVVAPVNQFFVGFAGVFKKGFVGKPMLVDSTTYLRMLGDGNPTSTQNSNILNDHFAVRVAVGATTKVLVSRAIQVDEISGDSADVNASAEIVLDSTDIGNNKAYKIEIPKNAILCGLSAPAIVDPDLVFTINIDNRGDVEDITIPVGTAIDEVVTIINTAINTEYGVTLNVASNLDGVLKLASTIFSSKSSIVITMDSERIVELFGSGKLPVTQYGNNGVNSKTVFKYIANDGKAVDKIDPSTNSIRTDFTVLRIDTDKTKSIVYLTYDDALSINPTLSFSTIAYTYTGSSTNVSSSKLIDSTANFTSELVGKKVYISELIYATIISVNSPTILTLSSNIFTAIGTSYTIGDVLNYNSTIGISQHKMSSFSETALFRSTTETACPTFNSKVDGIPVQVNGVYNYYDDGFVFATSGESASKGITVFAKNAGSWGNNIKVVIITKDYLESDLGESYANLFGNRIWKTTEFGVLVIEDGTVKENFVCSTNNEDLNENKQTYFFEDVTKLQSAYITMFHNGGTLSLTNQSREFNLVGGSDGTAHTEYDIANAYNVFIPEEIKTKIVVVGGSQYTSNQLSVIMRSVVNNLIVENGLLKKLDCFIPTNVPYEIINTFDPYASIKEWAKYGFGISDTIGNTKFEIHDTYFTVANPYGGKDILMPKSIMLLPNIVSTITNYGEWEAYAWKSRGVIGGVKKAVWTAKTLAEKEGIYLSKINPTYTSAEVAYFNAGQKTFSIDGSFTRTNQRLLFNLLESLGKDLADNFVFERNTPVVRSQIAYQYSVLLDSYASKGAIASYSVICDTSNNTPDIIAKNQLAVAVKIQYYTTAEIIVQTYYAQATV